MGLNTANFSVRFNGIIENTSNALAPISIAFDKTYSYTFAAGTGGDSADIIYIAKPTLSTTPTDIDLSGVLTDPAGNAIVFAEVCGIIVKNNSTTVGETVTVGGSSNDFLSWLKATGDGVKVAAKSVFSLCDPLADAYGVTNSTADLLRLVAATGTPSVDVIIWGRSVA